MLSFPSNLPVWGGRRGSPLSTPLVSPVLFFFCLWSPVSSSQPYIIWNRDKEKELVSLLSPFRLSNYRFCCCFGPARLSTSPPSPFKIQSLFYSPFSSISVPHFGDKYSTCHPRSPCRCPQPGAEAGACQLPRCICDSLPLWCPYYVRWSGLGPVSCRSKPVSTFHFYNDCKTGTRTGADRILNILRCKQNCHN